MFFTTLCVCVCVCVCVQECVFACLCLSDRIRAASTPRKEAKIYHGTARTSCFYQNNCSFLVSNETGHMPVLICASQTMSLYFHSHSPYQTLHKPNRTVETWLNILILHDGVIGNNSELGFSVFSQKWAVKVGLAYNSASRGNSIEHLTEADS